MAKSGSEFGYYWNFTIPKSDYDIQLVMVPSESSSVSISSYKLQNNVAIQEAKLNWEYDKLPIGSINPTLELTIDLNKCSNDLQKLLLSPFYDNSLSLFGSTIYAQTVDFRHGNYYDVKMKSKTTGDYVSVWQGVTSEIEVEVVENKLKVVVESIGKYILSQISIDLASHIYTTSTGESAGQFYDYAFRTIPTTGTPYYIYSDLGWSNNPKYYGWTSKLSDLNTFWQTLGGYFKAKITRAYDSTFNLDIFTNIANALYTQTFDGNCELEYFDIRNQRLSASEVYIVTHLSQYQYSDRATTNGYNSVKNNIAGGVFYMLKQTYSTLWDFVTEYAESNLLKMSSRNGVSFDRMLTNGAFGTGNTLNFLTSGKLYNLKVDLNYEVLKEVSSQYLDDTARNTKEFKAIATGNNKNGNSYTLVQALSTKALYPDDKTFEQRLGSGEYLSYCKQINNNQYYYKPASGDIKDSAGVALGRTGFYLKVHDIPNYRLNANGGYELDDYYDPTIFPVFNYERLKEIDSDNSNNALATASLMLTLFGVDKQHKITFDIEFDRFYNTVSSVDYSLFFFQEYSGFFFDLARINPNFASFPTKYITSKAELDLKSLFVNIEAISRGT